MFYLFCLLFISVGMPKLVAQPPPNWPSTQRQYLQGPVKTWTMKSGKQVIRKQQYDKQGRLKRQRFKGSNWFAPWYYYQLKKEQETSWLDRKPYQLPERTTLTYNKAGQIVVQSQAIPKSKKVNEIKNTFDANGRLLKHTTTFHTKATRHWNSTHHAQPTYEV